MHYKNGREAKEGDLVVFLDNYKKLTLVGQVHSITPKAESCNCQVAIIIPGGVTHRYETLGKMYYAEDALLAIEPLALAPGA